MEITNIELKIYLKNKRYPFTAILSNENQITKLYEELKTNDVIKFGDIIFLKENLKYIAVKYKK